MQNKASKARKNKQISQPQAFQAGFPRRGRNFVNVNEVANGDNNRLSAVTTCLLSSLLSSTLCLSVMTVFAFNLLLPLISLPTI